MKKTVIIAIALLSLASMALVGCGSDEESTDAGMDKVKAKSSDKTATERGGGEGSTAPQSDLKLPPGKDGGK